jgi:hypothetical protein
MIPSPTAIETYSGVWFDAANPDHKMVRLQDVAHALSILNRFAGHTSAPYSVAQHSVLCSYTVADEFKLEALLHDAHEAYVVDLPRPLKILLPEYQEVEVNVQRVVREAFGLPSDRPPAEVMQIDTRMMVTEAKALGLSWWGELGVEPLSVPIFPWGWQAARKMFLDRFKELA